MYAFFKAVDCRPERARKKNYTSRFFQSLSQTFGGFANAETKEGRPEHYAAGIGSLSNNTTTRYRLRLESRVFLKSLTDYGC